MRKCPDFLAFLKFREKMRVLLKKIISDGKEMSESINTEKINTEIDYASVRDPPNMYITVSNETTLMKQSDLF